MAIERTLVDINFNKIDGFWVPVCPVWESCNNFKRGTPIKISGCQSSIIDQNKCTNYEKIISDEVIEQEQKKIAAWIAKTMTNNKLPYDELIHLMDKKRTSLEEIEYQTKLFATFLFSLIKD